MSLASTWVSLRVNFVAEFPLTIIGIAVVFPLVFSISEAYKRREKALAHYGSLKAHVRHMAGLYSSPPVTGEISRSNQYLSKMLIDFENLKHIYQYRTPMTLRAYSKVFIFLLPILYGPYFAYLSNEFSFQTVLVLPILFSVILVGLDNIQDALESPFDQIGEDDILINAEKFVKNLEDQ